MIEVFQAEWCPHSRRVRQQLTESGVDFVARQVRADRDGREEMRQAVGTDQIPAVVLEGGEVLNGEADAIVAALQERFAPRDDAQRHREKAEAH
ncbi:MAG TPA: glutaredoxin family protein [Solirubrobacteraceae bacterium]|nr:glutaredoxin family protein [Solirubrobacteraceae bacterium]